MSSITASAAGVPHIDTEASPRHAPLGFNAFVALMAGLMALNALAIDIMIPGLPAIEAAFGLAHPNQAQTVITAYLLGFGIGQLFTGVLADRYGRRPVLLVGLVLYGISGFACLAAPDMGALLAARFVMGLGSAAPRVVAVAAVRDCYGGRRMARVMSLVMMVFMAMPIVAPAIGQVVLLTLSWHWVFGLLVIYSGLVFVFCLYRLPETLRPEYRRPIRVGAIREALGSILGSRQTVGYMLSTGTFFGAMFGFVNSAEQVMGEVLGLGHWFPAVFAVTAGSIAMASFINSRLVERFGMRLLSHLAATTFVLISLGLLGLGLSGLTSAWLFVPLISANMLFVGMVFSNFNALAMEPQQHVAGIASSLIGAVTVLLGACIGYLIGQAFDGTFVPMTAGFALSGTATLLIIAITERGRLFHPGDSI
ncbi:MAG: multidrug effflux MFS transporter [Pseudomonadota bacterium]|nr:multidrug effflux MFS transporter [Pseudomonadota bacterium]